MSQGLRPANLGLRRVFFSESDVGVVVEVDVTFAGYDPTGATVTLEVDGGAGAQPPRAMVFAPGAGSPPSTGVATYLVVRGEFGAGTYDAQVRFTKAGSVVNSELFQLSVQRSA